MASSWFFILLLKCIDFLSWPVLALGYPLYASIEAIESDSHSETRNLISYWILLSLIYLFEYAFLKLLQWFQYWHYMKLVTVAFLVMPDFGRAAYVYNQLIRSCFYMNPRAVISRFMSSKNIFAKKEDFIIQVEKYITQNGTEALEKLIFSSKNTEQSLHAETRKAAPTCTEKIEILKTNRGRLLMEQKDMKDLEMIEKEEVPEGKQANNAALDGRTSTESTSSAMEAIEKMPADTEYGKYPQISATENVQKEWTCAICQLTVPSEANMDSHLQGRQHKAACEALNMKTKATPVKDTRSEASPQVSASQNEQKMWTCEICQSTNLSYPALNSHLQGKKHKAASEALNTKTEGTAGTDIGNGASPHVSASTNVQKTWTCDICQLTMFEANMNSHLQGKKHKAKATPVKDTRSEASPQVSASQNEQKMWTCEICQLTNLSYPALNSHLQGKKHKAASEALNTKTEGTAGTDIGNGASPHVSASTNVQKTWTCDICQLTMFEANINTHLQGKKHKAKATPVKDARSEASPQVSASQNEQKMWTCEICQLTNLSYPALNSHLQGKKHKAASEALNTKTEGTAGTDIGNGASPHVSASTNVQKTWTCDICQLTMFEANMNSHLQGKKHKATCEALKVKSQLVA